LRETLWEWKLDFLADDAEVVLDELVSNARQHIRHCVVPGTGEVGEGEGPF
jgi:hypothetical protein